MVGSLKMKPFEGCDWHHSLPSGGESGRQNVNSRTKNVAKTQGFAANAEGVLDIFYASYIEAY
jgi:hypothetical protein